MFALDPLAYVEERETFPQYKWNVDTRDMQLSTLGELAGYDGQNLGQISLHELAFFILSNTSHDKNTPCLFGGTSHQKIIVIEGVAYRNKQGFLYRKKI